MPTIVNRGIAVLAAVATVCFGYLLYRYLALGTYIDHAETDVAISAWSLLDGEELYRAPDAPGFRLNGYGPLLFIVNAANLGLFGATIAVSKLANAAACLLAAGLFAVYVRRCFGWDYIGLGLFGFFCYLLIAAPVSFWVRPESLVLLTVTIGLLATLAHEGPRPWVTPLVIAACAGLSMNLKIHSFIFFVPLVLRYCSARWWRTWPLMALVAVAAFALPFAAPNISGVNYILGLNEFVAYRGPSPAGLRLAAKYSLVFALPVLVLGAAALAGRRRVARPDTVYLIAYVACLAAVIYPSSVTGSTWHQMLPFFPLGLDLCLRFIRQMEDRPAVLFAGQLVLILALGITSVTPQKRLLRAYGGIEKWSHGTAAEVARAIADNPGHRLQMGFGSREDREYRYTFVRPLLAFAGAPQFVSPVDAMEKSFAGWPPDADLIRRIETCEAEMWLVPVAAGQSFSMPSYYGGRTFPMALQRAFHAAYAKVATGTYFETWRCRR